MLALSKAGTESKYSVVHFGKDYSHALGYATQQGYDVVIL